MIIQDQVWLAACVSLDCVEFRDALSVLVRWRDVSPGLSAASERAAI